MTKRYCFAWDVGEKDCCIWLVTGTTAALRRLFVDCERSIVEYEHGELITTPVVFMIERGGKACRLVFWGAKTEDGLGV